MPAKSPRKGEAETGVATAEETEVAIGAVIEAATAEEIGEDAADSEVEEDLVADLPAADLVDAVADRVEETGADGVEAIRAVSCPGWTETATAKSILTNNKDLRVS
ncbi:MAG: hypothetical protein ACF8CQ_14320 [Rhodopirellula sp. JB044]|uniref:hypothetical protein n=1 Tax=Rhodopirellula sp. JB044 TaxID=3342844 RepID=UPI00370CCAE3